MYLIHYSPASIDGMYNIHLRHALLEQIFLYILTPKQTVLLLHHLMPQHTIQELATIPHSTKSAKPYTILPRLFLHFSSQQ